MTDIPSVKFRKNDIENRGYVDIEDDRSGSSQPEVLPRSSSGISTPEDDVFTIDQAIDAIGFGWFQVKLSLFTGLFWMADAMEMMILSILSPVLRCEWNLSSLHQASLTMIVFAGMMISSGIWGKISDLYGRKVELVFCSSVALFYGLLSSISPSFFWIVLLRGLVGLGVGGAPQSITLYAEFLPVNTRARCLVLIEFFWAIGTCFIVIVAIVIMPSWGWRYLLFIGSLPLLVFVISCLWLPESMRFDLARGKYEKALRTLKRIADDNGKPLPLGRLVAGNRNIGSPQETDVKKVEKRGQFKELFTPQLRTTTLLLWFLWFTNALSYFGIVLLTTELFSSDHICQENISKSTCAAKCTTLSRGDYMDLLYTTIAEFPGVILTFFIIDWLGRKWTIAVEFIFFGVFVLFLNTCTTRFIMASFIFVARAFISGSFQALYVYTPEVYPTTCRSLGLGACSGMARVGALITPFIAQVMIKSSLHLCLCIYGFFALLGAVAALLLPIETKGRTLNDSVIEISNLKTNNPKSRINH